MENSIFDSIIAGIFCCIGMDLWQRILFLIFNIPPTNWSTAGRWFIMMVSKKMIINQNLDNENPIKYELQIGWVFHYCVAIGYGFVYYFFCFPSAHADLVLFLSKFRFLVILLLSFEKYEFVD